MLSHLHQCIETSYCKYMFPKPYFPEDEPRFPPWAQQAHLVFSFSLFLTLRNIECWDKNFFQSIWHRISKVYRENKSLCLFSYGCKECMYPSAFKGSLLLVEGIFFICHTICLVKFLILLTFLLRIRVIITMNKIF